MASRLVQLRRTAKIELHFTICIKTTFIQIFTLTVRGNLTVMLYSDFYRYFTFLLYRLLYGYYTKLQVSGAPGGLCCLETLDSLSGSHLFLAAHCGYNDQKRGCPNATTGRSTYRTFTHTETMTSKLK